MLKKLLSLILALALVFTFMACDSKDRDHDDEDEEDSAVAENEDKETIIEKDDVITFEEQVVVDNDDMTIIIQSIDPDGTWGYTLDLYLENKTDKNLMFSAENANINDVMCDPFFATSVSAGKKANESLSFDNETLEAIGIDAVTKIEMTFAVYNEDDWSEDHLLDQTVVVYPMGEAAAKTYTRTPVQDEITVFDTEECTMVILATDPDNFWGYGVTVYLYNKTETTVCFTVDSAALNDYEMDPVWSTMVSPGKHAVETISWFDTDLEENGITEVESIWLEVAAYDWDNWMSDNFVETEIEFAPF